MKSQYTLIPASLLIIFLFYAQGVGGLFMLDDVANLELLFETINERGFWSGVLGGHSGPLGRPLSLFTFALQEGAWPNDPASFKWVNILIHVLNTALIILIVYVLLPHLFPRFEKTSHLYVSILIAIFWGLSPIQVSTTLYVIQRMVLLSSFFMLLAIAFYLWARAYLLKQLYLRTVLLMFCMSLCSLLSILAKESGLLVFAFILTIEYSIQKTYPINTLFLRRTLKVLLALPLVFFVGYLIYQGSYQHYDGRSFTLEERVLTQPRVLLDYVQQIVLPVQSSLGLYHDDYLKSRSLFDPLSTLFAIIVWCLVLLAAVIAWFKNHIWLFFAVFWFLSGHLMESTVIPLELYFEHRNYLSSLGVLIGVIGVVLYIFPYIKEKSISILSKILMMVYLGLILSITYSQITLWGSKGEYMLVSAKENPASLRARMLAIDYYDATGDLLAANEEISKIGQDFPDEIAIQLSQLHYACKNEFDTGGIKITESLLKNGRFSHASEATILKLVDLKKNNQCTQIEYQQLIWITNGLLQNSRYAHVGHRFIRVKSLLYFHMQEYKQSIQILEGLPDRGFADVTGLIKLYLLIGEVEMAQKKWMELNSQKEWDKYESQVLKELEQSIMDYKQQVDK